jgi:16S rRNA (guanine527-N7)-methyltransferase
MDPARIAELLRPFLGRAGEPQLTPPDLERISTYIDILVRWNSRINLTAIRDREEIVTRHFGESLFAASYLFPKGVGTGAESSHRGATHTNDQGSNSRPAAVQREPVPHESWAAAPGASDRPPTTDGRICVADIGSGAGFPGVPLRLWAPGILLTLIESNQKKAIFLREIVRSLTLTDVNIYAARAETLPPAGFDLVTLRAAERFATVLPVAAALVKPAGRLALLIGSAQVERARSVLPDRGWEPPLPIPGSHSRVLFVSSP